MSTYRAPSTEPWRDPGRICRDKGGWAQPSRVPNPQLCPVLGFVHQPPGGGTGQVGWRGELGSEGRHIWGPGAHISPVRTLGLRRSSRFPPKPVPPQTVAIQASDEKAFFMSQSETHEAHTTGVSNRGAGTGEGQTCATRGNLPDLVSSQPWAQLRVLGPTHGASTWKTEWGLGSREERRADPAMALPLPESPESSEAS